MEVKPAFAIFNTLIIIINSIAMENLSIIDKFRKQYIPLKTLYNTMIINTRPYIIYLVIIIVSNM